MRFLRTVIPSCLAVAVLCPGTGWAQEDLTLECTAGDATLSMDIERRSNYDADNHGYDDYINIEDCSSNEEWEINYAITGTFDNSDDLVLFRGNGCVEDTGTAFTEDEDCERAEEILPTVDEDGIGEIVLTVSQILSSCEGDGTEVVWLVLFPYDDQNNYSAYCTRSFGYDMAATDPPTLTSASGSDSGANIEWDHSSTDDQDHDEYIIYCAQVEGGGGEDGSSDCDAAASLPAGSDYATLSSFDCGMIDEGTTTSTRVSDLTNGQQYAFALAAVDQAGNTGVSSTPMCATPMPVDDFFSYYLDADGEAGFCFVATAAYDGNYDHPDVVQLRWLRDNMLRRFPGGTWMIGQYYRHGRDLATRLESYPRALSFVRSTLEVTTAGVRLGRAGGLWWSVILGLLALGACLRLGRRGAS